MQTMMTWLDQHKYAATEKAVVNAELIMANQFRFIHSYDMEPCREIVSFTEIDWLYTPNDDDEWIYMLNRQEYLLDLLVAFQLTGKVAYLIKAKELMLDWEKKCQHQPAEAWRTIDTGIRLMYWALILRELKADEQLLTKNQRVTLEKSITAQVTYLDTHYISKYDLSNWGVLITSGIIVMKQLHPNSISEVIYQRTIKRLTREIELQVQDSGLHWEQSPLYFMEVWRQVSVVWLSLKEELEVDSVISKCVSQMLEASKFLVKPDGYLLQQGDTDRIPINDMIQTVSLILGQPIPSMFAENLEVDLLLLQFMEDAAVVKQWPTTLQELSSHSIAKTLNDHQTGNYFYRDSWQNDASYLHVYNGPLGSGHGHASLGHLDFSYQGLDILIDPGRYTYQETKERQLLKSVESHNVLTINHEPFCQPKDSWAYAKSTTALSNQTADSATSYVTQINYNDQQEQGTYRVTRTSLWLKEEQLLVLFDYVQGNQLETVEQRLNFNPELEIKPEEQGLGWVITGKGQQQELILWSNYKNVVVSDGLYSPIYNELSQTKHLRSSTQVLTGSHVAATVIGAPGTNVKLCPVSQSGTENQVPEKNCFAVSLQTAKHNYLIVLQSEDTYQGHKLYYVADQPVYGKVSLLKDGRFQRLL